jgi:N-acetylmuramoyl-L-alanine amidase
MDAGWARVWRSKWARAPAAAVILAGCAFAVATAQAGGASVAAVRLGGDRNETRIVVDMDRAASGRVIESDGGAPRLSVVLAGVSPQAPMRGGALGLVKAWKVEAGDGGARLTLDLAAAGRIRRRFVLPPADGVTHYRYVIDIDPAVAVAAAARAAPPAEVAAAPPPAHTRKVVVIDPGHGGKDPGAEGGGAMEKIVTLAAAKELKSRLERGGHYRVVMTRSTDVFIPLEERVRIARRAGADLFISLHADSAGADPATHGASVYTVSDHGEERVTQVLGRNEWFNHTGARAADPAVGRILLDLTQRSTRNRSAIFAQLIVDRLGDQIDLLPNSHRDAGYFVLLAPDVPAVLLEMGFISSPDDVARLSDPAARGKMMDAVAAAIDAYFTGQARLAAR